MEVADGFLTNALIRLDIASEANPVMFGLAGKSSFPVFKFAGVLLAVIILWDIHRRHPRLAFWTALTFLIVYTGIVAWNGHLLILS
jgi:hypothetical protein